MKIRALARNTPSYINSSARELNSVYRCQSRGHLEYYLRRHATDGTVVRFLTLSFDAFSCLGQ